MSSSLPQQTAEIPNPRQEPTLAELAELERAYLSSRYCDLYHDCQDRWQPMDTWRSPDQRVFAARVLENLGDGKTGRQLVWRAFHDDRQNPTAQDAWARIVLERHGPYEALQRVAPPAPHWSDTHRAHRHLSRADQFSHLRDFRRSDAELARAHEILGDSNGWYWTVRSYALRLAEKHREALQMAERGLAHAPHYRPLILSATTQMLLMGDTTAGAKLLHDIMPQVQSSAIAWYLAAVELELNNFDSFHAAIAQIRSWAIRADESHNTGLLCLEMEAWHRVGDTARLRAACDQLPENDDTNEVRKHWREMLGRDGKRVCLPVPRVPQAHMTCAPATLTSIANFHDDNVEHDAVAKEICFNGTPAWRERAWAENRGWLVREFTVTWDAAVNLIDAGLPFTLTLTGPTAAHLQAVAGYDQQRKQLLIRDPSNWSLRLLDWSWIEEQQAVRGPRGMALAPPTHAQCLEKLVLPDSDRWQHLHELEKAAELGQRNDMARSVQALEADDPNHRLTLDARLRLAYFDQDWARAWTVHEVYQSKFPDNSLLVLQHLHLLRMNGRMAEVREYLAEQAKQPRPPPHILDQWAQLVREDLRQQQHALSLVRRAVSQNWTNGIAYAIMGDCLEALGQLDEAAFVHHIALRLSPGNQSIARSYFSVMSALGRREEALHELQADVDVAGELASEPVLVLSELMESTGRDDVAMRLLEEAAVRRPHDAAIAMARARRLVRAGRNDQAQQLMVAIREQSQPLDWYAHAGDIADWAGDRESALAHWRACLDGDPRRIDIQRRYARGLAEQHGIDAAIAHLRDATAAQPDHALLALLLGEWLREQPDQAIAWARQQATARPYDPWWQRELGSLLLRHGDREEAASLLQGSVELDPRNPASWGLLAEVRRAQDDFAGAADAYRTALTLSIDYRFALDGLMAVTPSEHRREALAFAHEQLQRQVVFGDGIAGYVACARGVLTPEEVLTHVREAHAARPDLFPAWSTLIEQLLAAGHQEEAYQFAVQCTEQFPLMPQAWQERAAAARVLNKIDDERTSLEQACLLAPWLSAPARDLADHYNRHGNMAGRRQVLERIVRADPLDTINLGWLAELEWSEGNKDVALSLLERCCREHPAYEWAWTMLDQWGKQHGRNTAALDLAKQLVEQRQSAPDFWERFVRCALQADDLTVALESVDRLLAIDPRSLSAHALRIQILGYLGREEDALKASQPDVFGTSIPSPLRLERARLLTRSGLPAAIAEAQAIIRNDPGFTPAHRQLIDWQHAAKDHQACLASAQALVAQAPGDARSWGYLAQAQDEAIGKSSAIESLQRALRIDPHYFYAGFQLCRIALREKQTALAHETLEQLRRYTQDVRMPLLAACVAAARNEQAGFDHAIEEFIKHPEVSSPALDDLLELVGQVGSRWTTLLQDHIDRIGNQATAPAMQAHWVEAQVKRRRQARVRSHLENLPQDHPAFVAAAATFLDCLAEKVDADELIKTRKSLESKLKSNTLLWGKTGYALSACNLEFQARTWLTNWRDYPQAEPWMLYNFQLMLRVEGRWQEALPVMEAALQQPPDQTTPNFQLLVAIEYALSKQCDRAQSLINQARQALPQLDEYQNFWLLGAEALLVAARSANSHDNRTVVQACKQLSQTLKDLRNKQSGLSSAQAKDWERLARHLAKCGGWRTWWWAWRQGFFTWPF